MFPANCPSNTPLAFPAGCFTFRMPPVSKGKVRGQESLHLYREAAIAPIHQLSRAKVFSETELVRMYRQAVMAVCGNAVVSLPCLLDGINVDHRRA